MRSVAARRALRRGSHHRKWTLLALAVIGLASSQVHPATDDAEAAALYHVVDCLLPGQIRQLGRRSTYISARRPVRTSAGDCRIRGGEYVAYDRADLATALRAWLPLAAAGDGEAQVIVGELHEKGLGTAADPGEAARWYRLAAEGGNRQAQVNLGHLFERGLGVEADPQAALSWYRLAAGSGRPLELDNKPAREIPAHLSIELPAAAQAGLLAGPEITLVDPVLAATRDIVLTAAATAGQTRAVIGRVTAPAGLLSVTVNGEAVTPNELGVFRGSVEALDTDTPVDIVAVDRQGKRAELAFVLRSRPPVSRHVAAAAETADASPRIDVDFGRYHALLIGNARYDWLPALATPVNDVRAIAALLEWRFGFHTRVLENATRYQMLSALNELRETLTPDDNLLVYYAGHGELDEVNQRGHWLPVDAERDSTANWIATVAITDLLNIMRAKQVLVVVDSCYAGAMTRSSLARLDTAMTQQEKVHWLRTMAGKRARTVLTSGGLAPVMDGGGGRHSVFARAFIDVLDAQGEVLDGHRLHREVAARVAYAAANLRFEQVPEYAPIRFAGHEFGDFFLVPQPR